MSRGRFLRWLAFGVLIASLALALAFGAMTALWGIEWRAICRGGQANPAFHSAECADLDTVIPFGLALTAIFALPAALALLRSRLRR